MPCGHGLLGVEAVVVGKGANIEWVVSSGGHKGVGLLFLLGEEKHTQRKRER